MPTPSSTTTTTMTASMASTESACQLWCLDRSAVSALLASTLQNIGALHHRSGRLDEALRSYGEAVQVWIDASNQLTETIRRREEERGESSEDDDDIFERPMIDVEGREECVSRLIDARMLEARLKATDDALEAKRNDERSRSSSSSNSSTASSSSADNHDGSQLDDLRRSSILVNGTTCDDDATTHSGHQGGDQDARCSIATALYNMGLVYHETQHWNEARSMYESALDTLSDCCTSDYHLIGSLLTEVRKRIGQVDEHQRRARAVRHFKDAALKEASRSALEGHPAAAAA
mmetsp:Transcript_52095/g.156324  ORF Transcript_52095/g.156324 Transcript_52095/m.156324 type:complete len:292 (-) Transcript_52095:88-963(-)